MTRLGASKFILPLALLLLVQCSKGESGKLASLLKSILGSLQNIEKLLKDDSLTINKSPTTPLPQLPSTGRRSAQPGNNGVNKDPASEDIWPMNVPHGSSRRSSNPNATLKSNRKTKKQPKLRSRIEQGEGNTDSSSSSKNEGKQDVENLGRRLFSEPEEAA